MRHGMIKETNKKNAEADRRRLRLVQEKEMDMERQEMVRGRGSVREPVAEALHTVRTALKVREEVLMICDPPTVSSCVFAAPGDGVGEVKASEERVTSQRLELWVRGRLAGPSWRPAAAWGLSD